VEQIMSKSLRAVMALSLVVFVAACAKKVEEPTYVTEPVQSAPVYTGKYK
jgi:uncharacterized lipoprotein YehR (DUF1307 family)